MSIGFAGPAHAAVVAGAVLLGYVFNFARLCLLVVYYLVALHFPSLQHRAKLADYIIGGCLFLFATFLLFYVIGGSGTRPARSNLLWLCRRLIFSSDGLSFISASQPCWPSSSLAAMDSPAPWSTPFLSSPLRRRRTAHMLWAISCPDRQLYFGALVE